MLGPFVYQPLPYSNDNGGPRESRWRVVLILTIVVVLVSSAVTVLGAELPLPSRIDNRTRPVDPRCNTAARYDAMREAYERRLPDPCSRPRATVWRE